MIQICINPAIQRKTVLGVEEVLLSVKSHRICRTEKNVSITISSWNNCETCNFVWLCEVESVTKNSLIFKCCFSFLCAHGRMLYGNGQKKKRTLLHFYEIYDKLTFYPKISSAFFVRVPTLHRCVQIRFNLKTETYRIWWKTESLVKKEVIAYA
jgi:hypothetical protein